ncbi:MAG: DUF2520 domain-containing protein [Jatrophihabitans sp.]|nr:MAG: DUF2520 domain-containing protein [Jatrophihabitans sp.]
MTADRPGRLRVGVLGAGRVGGTLGAALARAGHDVVAVAAVSEQSRRRAQRLLPGAAILPPDEVVAAADLVLLAVPDDELRALVAGLAGAGAWRSGQIAAHTSGAQGIAVLDPAAARGVLALALHPVMTFTGRPEDLDRLDGVPFGVTAPDGARPVAESLVVEMGGEPVWVPETARPLYHAALSVGSNHLVTVVNDALSLLADAGIGDGPRLLAPLLSASLDNVLRLGDAALTGPVSRGDAVTVGAHLRTLRDASPAVVPGYVALARRSAERAHAAGRLDDHRYAAVLDVLARA